MAREEWRARMAAAGYVSGTCGGMVYVGPQVIITNVASPAGATAASEESPASS